MARLPFVGGEIRGQIIEVLLPKRKDEGERDCSYLKTLRQRFKIIAQTVYLQVGEYNNIHVGLVDLTMPDDISDCLTEVSEDDELVVRVLQRHGAWEEHVLIGGATRIRADFVRIIPPLDEEFNSTLDSEINACHALIGDKHKIVINPCGLRNMFDSQCRPVLRVLLAPAKSTASWRGARDFPKFGRDHLVVLEIRENRYTARAFKFSLADSCSLSTVKNTMDYYNVKVSVSECGEDEKKESRDGVLFKREASFDRLRGVVGYWFRFQAAKRRYAITFSLWRKRAGTQTCELLDEVQTIVETSDRNCNKQQKRLPKTISEESALQGRISMNPTSLPEQSHMADWTSERKILLRKNRKERHQPKPISEETLIPGKVHGKHTPLPDQGQQSTTTIESKKPLPVEVIAFLEQSAQVIETLLPLRDDGKWEEFDRQVEQLLEKYEENTDSRIAVILEQAMAACYRNELSSAENFVKKAMAVFPQVPTLLVRLMKGRASCYLAGIYRRDKMKLGKAQRCIEAAKKHLKNADYIFDRACLAYEEGCLQCEQAHMSCMAEQAKQCFDQCIKTCSLGSIAEDPNNLLFVWHDLALMKKAMLLLDCFTKSGRESRSVKEETLLEAKGCFNRLKIDLVSKMSTIAQVQYHLARSDQYFREQRLVDACGHAQLGFDLSLRYRFHTIDAAEARLNYFNRLRNSS